MLNAVASNCELSEKAHNSFRSVTKKLEQTIYDKFGKDADSFLWQLFTEGVAMYFEQILIGDSHYYHQDKDSWKKWCDDHLEKIKADFNRDLKSMTCANQRYFGDWVE